MMMLYNCYVVLYIRVMFELSFWIWMLLVKKGFCLQCKEKCQMLWKVFLYINGECSLMGCYRKGLLRGLLKNNRLRNECRYNFCDGLIGVQLCML